MLAMQIGMNGKWRFSRTTHSPHCTAICNSKWQPEVADEAITRMVIVYGLAALKVNGAKKVKMGGPSLFARDLCGPIECVPASLHSLIDCRTRRRMDCDFPGCTVYSI